MKIVSYQEPKSSFLSLEKDLSIITNLFLKNERLKRLLYYTVPNALDKSNLTSDQTYELFGKNIRIVPKLDIDILLFVKESLLRPFTLSKYFGSSGFKPSLHAAKYDLNALSTCLQTCCATAAGKAL